MNYEILEVRWYNQFGTRPLIGIIKIKTKFNEIETYIGTASGFNETDDIKKIVSYGAKMSEE